MGKSSTNFYIKGKTKLVWKLGLMSQGIFSAGTIMGQTPKSFMNQLEEVCYFLIVLDCLSVSFYGMGVDKDNSEVNHVISTITIEHLAF